MIFPVRRREVSLWDGGEERRGEIRELYSLGHSFGVSQTCSYELEKNGNCKRCPWKVFWGRSEALGQEMTGREGEGEKTVRRGNGRRVLRKGQRSRGLRV